MEKSHRQPDPQEDEDLLGEHVDDEDTLHSVAMDVAEHLECLTCSFLCRARQKSVKQLTLISKSQRVTRGNLPESRHSLP